MAKKPTPMINLAGSPGNLQDVSDLQQMLAQTQAEIVMLKKQAQRFRAKGVELFQHIEKLKDEIEDEKSNAENIQSDLNDAEERADEAEAEARELREAMEHRAVELVELIRVRDALFNGGDVRAAREDLDILLNRMEPSWRCGGCNVGQAELY